MRDADIQNSFFFEFQRPWDWEEYAHAYARTLQATDMTQFLSAESHPTVFSSTSVWPIQSLTDLFRVLHWPLSSLEIDTLVLWVGANTDWHIPSERAIDQSPKYEEEVDTEEDGDAGDDKDLDRKMCSLFRRSRRPCTCFHSIRAIDRAFWNINSDKAINTGA